MKLITIITGQHLVSNPRVWKEANALCKAGYSVSVFTIWYDQKKVLDDKALLNGDIKYFSLVNQIPGYGSILDRFAVKITRRIAILLKALFGIELLSLIVPFSNYYAHKILVNKADLYICHQETGLVIGSKLLKKGLKVAFDFEDWYSEDYINSLRPRRLLRMLEKFAWSNACYITVPSGAMLKALSDRYGSSPETAVIYNSFPICEHEKVVSKRKENSMVWFSQVIGPGRGLERFLQAIFVISIPTQVHLLGASSAQYRDKLTLLCSENSNVSLIFHDPLPPNSLPSFLSQFRFGLALEEVQPLSRFYTITNKIFQYLEGGLAVIATSTEGQMEVAKQYPSSVHMLPKNHAKWGRFIEQMLLKQEDDLVNFVTDTLNPFVWSKQEVKLIKVVADSLR